MNGHEMKALVVDDDAIARKTIRFALEQEGFYCDVAVDGEDASCRLGQAAYSLVVTDLRMPKKHGHALSIELLQQKKRPIVVVHSSVDDPGLTKDLMLRGVDDIIYKPANYAAFAAKMKALVTRQSGFARPPSPSLSGGSAAAPVETEDMQEPDAPMAFAEHSTIPGESAVPLSDIEENLPLMLQIMPVSKAALDVFEMTRTGGDARKLGEAIRRDAALAAEMLSIANSNFYNSTGKAVTELEKAVVRIGQRRTGELALAASTLSGLTSRQLSWLDNRTTWRQSIAAGVAFELLVAQGKHEKLESNLALVAFVHSLGRVVLGTFYPNHYRRLIKQCKESQESLVDQEPNVFPENHAKIMARLLANWKVSEEICELIPHILDSYGTLTELATPTQTKAELIKLAVFIGQLVTGSWHPWDRVEIPPASLLKRLQIHDVAKILEQTRENTQAIIDFQSADSSEDRKQGSLPKIEETGRQISYKNISNLSFDYVAQLIRDMGIKLVPLSAKSQPQGSTVLINGIGAGENDPRSECALADDVKSLLLTDRRDGTGTDSFGETLQLPANYGGLRAALLEIAD